MNEAEIARYIVNSFENIHVIESNGNRFFYFGPFDLERNQWPFCTLVVNDEYDQFSALNRSEVARLNVGVSKATFQGLFGDLEEEQNFSALDRIMPHPVYGKMYWICVLNPDMATWKTTKKLLVEAYEVTKKKWEKPEADQS